MKKRLLAQIHQHQHHPHWCSHRRTHHLAFQRNIRSAQEGTVFREFNLRAVRCGAGARKYSQLLPLGWVEILVPKPQNEQLGVPALRRTWP
jgi:hypothetical protein